MKRNLLVGAVVVAAIIALVVTRCSGHAKSSQDTHAATGSAASTVRGAVRDKHVDPRTLPRASISGTVTDAVTKAPVAGARVCGDAFAHALSSQQTREPLCATADAQGAYTLKDVVPAGYHVGASARSYRPGTYKAENGNPLVVAPRQNKTGVDIVLRPGGVEITGTVSDITGGPIAQAVVRATVNWQDYTPTVETDAAGKYTLWAAPGRALVFATADGYTQNGAGGRTPGTFDIVLTPESTLAGLVVDAVTAEPVAGVRVRLITPDAGMLEQTDDASDITDAQGAFRIAKLSPGRYEQYATSPHGYGRSDGSTLVGLGQHVEGLTIKLHAGAHVSGKVMKPDNTVCANASVSMTDRKAEAWARMRTEPDGEVHADGVIPATYKVEVNCDGWIARDNYDPVTVTDKDITGLVWQVDAGATIRGRLVTRSGAPVPDARVTARGPIGGLSSDTHYMKERTGLDGSFEITGLPAGAYRLDAGSDAGITPNEGWPADVKSNETIDKQLVLDDGGSLTGSVVDANGKPVAGVTVHMTPQGNGRGNSTRTETNGTFAIMAIVPDEYRVIVQRGRTHLRKPGAADDHYYDEMVTLRGGKTATVKFVVEAETGWIKGSVIDTKGTPAPDAYITASRESDASGGSSKAVTATRWDQKPIISGVDGTFTVDGLTAGRYTVRAYIRGGGEAFAEHVAVGSTTKLQLRATASIAGTVTSAAGVIDDLTIELREPATGFYRSETFYRTKGAFTVSDLPPGSFTLTASTRNGKKQIDLGLAEGETKAGLAVQLDALVTITGRVIDAVTKKPVRGFSMNTSLEDGAFSAHSDAATGDDGRFSVEKAPTGAITLRGSPDDYSTSEYGGVMADREVAGTGTVDVGDLVAFKRRLKDGEKAGDLGFKLADDPPRTPIDKRIFKVSVIDPQGPAARSGLVIGDIITSIDGHSVTGRDAANTWILINAPPGTKLVLGLERGASVTIMLR